MTKKCGGCLLPRSNIVLDLQSFYRFLARSALGDCSPLRIIALQPETSQTKQDGIKFYP